MQDKLDLGEEVPPGFGQKELSILERVPEWNRLEDVRIIQSGGAAIMRGLHQTAPRDRPGMMSSDPDIIRIMLNALRAETDPHAVQYSLTLMVEVVREDHMLFYAFMKSLRDDDLYEPFMGVLQRAGVDSYTADKAAWMLTGFMCRAPRNLFSKEQVDYVVHALVRGKFPVSEVGCMSSICNILKQGAFREMVWTTRGGPQLIKNGLDSKRPSLYHACFCVWLMSFSNEMLPALLEDGLIAALCNVMKECKIEKVVRCGIHTLTNCLDDDSCVEVIIDQDIVHTLTLLEYEKWRDDEMYSEIRQGLNALQSKIKQYSNFGRYCRELEKGSLRPGFLHSEKFWSEHYMQFEQDEFAAIKKLGALLRSGDPVTQAVALFDLGEFARLHPLGKKILTEIGVKERAMMFMSHDDKEVSMQALLCVQKIMVDKWQDVGKSFKTDF